MSNRLRDTASFLFKGTIQNYPLRYGKIPFVFIHINKTGGTSIAKTLNLPSKSHFTAEEVISLVGKNNWDHAYKFCFVRNPFDKVFSHFKYRIKSKQLDGSISKENFDRWVCETYGELYEHQMLDSPKMFKTQCEWIDPKGASSIDFIGRFEKINADFEIIAKALGIKKGLPHMNRTDFGDSYNAYYTPKSKKIIESYFKEDMERFSYVF